MSTRHKRHNTLKRAKNSLGVSLIKSCSFVVGGLIMASYSLCRDCKNMYEGTWCYFCMFFIK